MKRLGYHLRQDHYTELFGLWGRLKSVAVIHSSFIICKLCQCSHESLCRIKSIRGAGHTNLYLSFDFHWLDKDVKDRLGLHGK